MDQERKTQRRGKLTIRLKHWYYLSLYAGILAVSLGFPRLQDNIMLFPSLQGSRCFMMIWALLLMGLNLLWDKLYITAYRKDLHEQEKKMSNAGLHVPALQAVAAPVMLVLDIAVMVHILWILQQSGMRVQDEASEFQTAAMAAGAVLWIYARRLPYIRYKSIWGIRTKAAMKDVQSWGLVHLRAMPFVEISGLLAMTAGTFLTGRVALGAAILACAVAFFGMFFPFTKQAQKKGK